jgi:hypothetical protein
MDPQPWHWHWGSLFAYSLLCFFAGFFTGVVGIPGIIPVGAAAVVGAYAAHRRWLEVQSPPLPQARRAPLSS